MIQFRPPGHADVIHVAYLVKKHGEVLSLRMVYPQSRLIKECTVTDLGTIVDTPRLQQHRYRRGRTNGPSVEDISTVWKDEYIQDGNALDCRVFRKNWGKLKTESILGEGFSSSVLETTHTDVVVKLTIDHAYEEEIDVLKHIAHVPNVIHLLDYLDTDKVDFGCILFPRFECTLKDFIVSAKEKKTQMDNAFYVDMITQILHGLMGLATIPVIHHDICAKNILLIQNPLDVVISDFGIAERSNFDDNHEEIPIIDDRINEGVVPPEARTSDMSYTTKVDIWATGQLIMFILLGEEFETADVDNFETIRKQILHGEQLGRISGLDRRVHKIAKKLKSFGGRGHKYDCWLKMVAENPDERPTALMAWKMWSRQ